MEFDPRSIDRLPFHDPAEAEQAHLIRRRPPATRGPDICSEFCSSAGSTRASCVGSPSSRGSSRFPRGLWSRRLASRAIHSSSSSTVRWRCELRSERVASYSPATFFGEMSLVDGEPRSATIVATTELRLLVVDRSHFGGCWMRPRIWSAGFSHPVTSRATPRANGARDTPWYESSLMLVGATLASHRHDLGVTVRGPDAGRVAAASLPRVGRARRRSGRRRRARGDVKYQVQGAPTAELHASPVP